MTATEVLALLYNTPGLLNPFITALFQMPGAFYLANVMFKHDFAWVKRGSLKQGDYIVQIFIQLADIYQYNVNDQSYPLVADAPSIEKEIHRINFKKMYKRRLAADTLAEAFLEGLYGFEKFLNDCIYNLYDTAEYDEFLCYKYLIASRIANGLISSRSWAADASKADQSALIKETTDLFGFKSTSWNLAGVPNQAEKSNVHVIMTAKFAAERDNGFLASVFNLDKTYIADHYNIIDSFGFTDAELARLNAIMTDDDGNLLEGYTPITSAQNTVLKTIPCVLVDENWFQVYDTRVNLRMEEATNPMNLNRYYFLHVWRVLSTSMFHNAVVFLSGTNGLSAIELGTLVWDGTNERYAWTSASTVSDLGYGTEGPQPIVVPIAVASSGNGIYDQLGETDPSLIKISITSEVTALQTAIKNGEITVAPAPGYSPIYSSSTDITSRSRAYEIRIAGSIRQAADVEGETPTYSARTATIKFTYKGKEDSLTLSI